LNIILKLTSKQLIDVLKVVSKQENENIKITDEFRYNNRDYDMFTMVLKQVCCKI